MSSGNYETQILDAIQMLVDNAVSKANYDKTIQGTISRCVDATIGKYIVKYQNSSFYAYSYNTDITYPAGTSVYVLVPGNDMSKDKSIIGTVDKLGPDYVSIIEGENGYEVTGVNVINSDAIFELCSYKEQDVKILYDRDNDVDLINLDAFGFESYIKKSNALICGATFKTSLPAEQQFRGDYGIAFNLDFMDNATGETVTKTYMVNIDQMKGNPYSYTTSSRQYSIFDVDGANFISIKQIYIFEYDFPNIEEDKNNDIFISKVELSAANALDATEAATCALTFITPEGTYFDDNDLDSDTVTLQAQIRIKGNAIDNDSQLVKYYWFVENNNITNKSEHYNQYGGAGWECLNNYNIIEAATEDSGALIQWVSGTYEYKTKKEDNVAKETNYKCVAVYNNDTVLSKTITIYNYSSDYAIEIKSDSGTAFYYDLGTPTLTCYINGEEVVSDLYSYVWSEINNVNQFAVLNETIETNELYNDAVEKYNALLTQVANEEVLTGQIQEELNLYARIIAQYENTMRVEENKIHKLQISRITNFSTYKCSVYKNGVFIGTASIIISNSLQNENPYTLVIDNGNQVFKYNTQGISPTNLSLDNPVTILPLSFTLYDNQGQKINYNAIGAKNVYWTVPNKNTLINISTSHGNPTEETATTATYVGYEELNFDIDTRYDFTKDNNEIQLTVHYKDKVISAKTNFTFTKEGEAGTNGTDFICKIVPNIISGDVAPLYPTVTFNEYNQQYSLNYTPVESEKWFRAQLWHDGELIFDALESGKSEENADVQLEWQVLKNNYGEAQADESNFSIDIETGAITFIPNVYSNAANIIRCKITYNEVEYYANMPIIVSRVNTSDYTIDLVERSGFRQVMYTADGQTPAYDSANPFEIQVTQMINGVKEDVSQLELSDYKVDYDWSVEGAVYYSEWKSEQNLIEKTLYASREKRNQKYFEPVDTYNGLCVNNAVTCTISRDEEYIGSIHIPVYFYINRYGNSAINGWDGNSISINEDNSGIILAPQVGAGKKNADNTFTGVFMGSVKEAGAEIEEHGLFGYNAGQRTIALNAVDGSAEFGVEGSGQIRIDPSSGEAILTSGNYDTEAGTGMIINLSEPSIKFGSGNFEVDKDGYVTAVGFATAKDLSDTKEEIQQNIEQVEESIKAFIVEFDFTSFGFACNTEQYPITDYSFTTNYAGYYKNKIINSDKLDITMTSEAVEGITVDTSQKGVITFAVAVDTQIPNLTNTFTFDIGYTDTSNITYTETKSIYIGLNVQGKDGAKGEDGQTGETGKSAYQIWLDEGNTGTEEDYLNSLKGSDGEDGKSAYELWLEAGNTGSEEDYLNSLKGADGDTGKSAYEIWLEQGNEGTEEEYLESLKGADGEPGATGNGVKTSVVMYQVSDNGQDIPTGEWQLIFPSVEDGQYLWTKTTTTYTDGTITEAYSVSKTGTDGNDGVSITIKETSITYQIGESGTDAPTGEWLEEIPEQEPPYFLWTKTIVVYSDETETTSYSVSYISKDGEQGEKGEDGADAKLVTITASSTIFKSNTGKNGTFYPNYITLSPDFQGVTGETITWQYSLDGETWEEVVDGEHEITLNAETRELAISKDSDLFTDDNSVITFKCIAEDDTTYNTISISKLYDVVDLTIGARNYALNTATSLFITPTSTIYYSDFYELVESLNNFIGEYVTISAEFRLELADGASVIGADDQFAFFGQGEAEAIDDGTETVADDETGTQLFYQTLGCPGYLLKNLKTDNFIKKSFTFLVTEDSFVYDPEYIGLEIRTSSALNGVTIVMQKLKVETGQVATDWTIASEDLEEEIRIEYAATENYTDEISNADWTKDYSSLQNTTNKWIWQRTAIYQRNILISASEKACIGKPEKTITETTNLYYVYDSSTELPTDLTDEDWSSSKPIWTSADVNNYLWVKTTYIYSDNTASTAAAYCDLTWSELGTLDSNLASYKDDFTNQLVGGVVKIENGEIRIYDNANTSEAERCIVMNSSGIGYLFKDADGKWPEDGEIISVWGIDGTFDARLLTVINLSADEINDGVLRLGGSISLTPIDTFESVSDLPSTGNIGDAYRVINGDSYDWYVWDNTNGTWMLRESGYLIVSDLNNNEVAKISADGLEILADDDSSVHIFAENDNDDGLYGLCLKDANQQIIAYTDTTSSTWNVKKQVIEESLTFAPSIQIVQIENTQDGNTINQGIGFVSILSDN